MAHQLLPALLSCLDRTLIRYGLVENGRSANFQASNPTTEPRGRTGAREDRPKGRSSSSTFGRTSPTFSIPHLYWLYRLGPISQSLQTYLKIHSKRCHAGFVSTRSQDYMKPSVGSSCPFSFSYCWEHSNVQGAFKVPSSGSESSGSGKTLFEPSNRSRLVIRFDFSPPTLLESFSGCLELNLMNSTNVSPLFPSWFMPVVTLHSRFVFPEAPQKLEPSLFPVNSSRGHFHLRSPLELKRNTYQ